MKTNTNKTINTLKKSLIVASVAAAIAGPVSAKQIIHTNYDYAPVVNVKLVVQTYRVNNPVEQCWNEEVRTRSSASRSHTTEIIGGLIGAAIGHEFGSGRGQDLATVAGAVLGASVGRDIKNQNTKGATYKVVERCEIVNSYTTQERIVGYDVAYRYNGKVFYTQTSTHPGKQIKLRVNATPA